MATRDECNFWVGGRGEQAHAWIKKGEGIAGGDGHLLPARTPRWRTRMAHPNGTAT